MAISRDYVLDFVRARENCDAERLAAFLDDDVDWLLSGPVDFLPHCGHRKGKAAVIDMVCRIATDTFETRNFEMKHLLVQGDYAATLSRFHATQAITKRTISYSGAHFMRFRNDKLLWFRGLIDSLSATEQVVGHELNLDYTPELISIAPDGELVEI
ncbi:MAG: nuclear transport factor 2 family protein [Pseudorhodoplanes sp.]|jgi:ketosteroid isomerase-like protein|nr:nuclear transport factor 2 family protein [Pseudorhodoplanes sp.]